MSRTTNQYSHRFVGVAHGVGAMGWLRLVGSIKLQVSFAEYSLLYRALLQKRPIKSILPQICGCCSWCRCHHQVIKTSQTQRVVTNLMSRLNFTNQTMILTQICGCCSWCRCYHLCVTNSSSHLHVTDSMTRLNVTNHKSILTQICGCGAWSRCYGVATVSRIDKITGLFCRISSLW